MAREPADTLVVTALGMATPLGLGADATCAAIRSGLSRFTEIPSGLVDEAKKPLRVVAAPLRGVTDGLLGLGRWSRLASEAIGDLLANAGLPERELGQVGLFVALPSPDRTEVDPRIFTDLGARLEQWCKIRGAAARTKVFPLGHAGALRALEEAEKSLRGRTFTAALVGGVDSLVEPGAIAAFHGKGRLKTGDRPVGLLPGEGAAFALIEPLWRADARGAPPLAVLGPARTATEAVTIDQEGPCDGTGLSEAVTGALAGRLDLGLLVSDLNGEPYRSEELAYMTARALRGVKTPWRLWHAADAIGDTGAASAAISIALAARALHRGYAGTRTALVCASSDGGLRGAVVLGAPTS